jgi:hypothetical protein
MARKALPAQPGLKDPKGRPAIPARGAPLGLPESPGPKDPGASQGRSVRKDRRAPPARRGNRAQPANRARKVLLARAASALCSW